MITKRKPKKWTKKISIHDVSVKHHRTGSTDADDVFVAVLDEWVASYTESILFREEYRKRYLIDWSCFTCKTTIQISIKGLIKSKKPIDRQSFYCDKCKPKKMTIRLSSDPILVRYINSFYTSIRLRIRKHSNLLDLL